MNRWDGRWHGKRIWIIGASSGIGRACARRMLAHGASVALSARSEGPLAEAAGGWPRALVQPLDVTERASVGAAHDAILAAWGGIDLVLLMAGGFRAMRAHDFDLRSANALLALNLSGVYNCLDAVLPVLLRQRAGGIVLVASVAGFRGLPHALAYGPTKAALINLAEALYLDLHRAGIGVYLVNPGFVATPLTAANTFPMPALISAEEAAAALMAGIEDGQFHIHFPRRFSNPLRLARLLPYRLYFWLVHKVTGL